jgi:hypothetical protein
MIIILYDANEQYCGNRCMGISAPWELSGDEEFCTVRYKVLIIMMCRLPNRQKEEQCRGQKGGRRSSTEDSETQD